MKNIRYYSTNHNSRLVSFKKALLQGQAPDKGLYMPDFIPQIISAELSKMKELSYPEIAFLVANKFLEGEIPEKELKRIVKEAYNFAVPLEKIESKKYIMRLDQGPTASFKDFAARMMARLMHYYIQSESRNLTILTATSGDTGSAVANAFHNLEGIKVVVLFPLKEVSDRQRKQMTALDGNVNILAFLGKFDDGQAMVKRAFSDEELEYLDLSSANSINFGRLLPQIVYYFYAYSRLCGTGEKIIYSVPSGNFGNLTGGLIAKKMGLPVYKFVAAVNDNDEFPRFLKTGKYRAINPSKNCLSNAMNVGNPSNLARIIDLYGGQMDERGIVNKLPDMEKMQKDIFSVSVSDETTRETIKSVYEEFGSVLEPHGAVAWAGLQKFLSEDKISAVSVSLETAHPAKFPDEIRTLLKIEPDLPESLKNIETKREEFKIIPADYQKFKDFLKKEI